MTRSQPAVLLGVQRPRRHRRPPLRGLDLADAADALDFAAGYGLVADEWQEWVVEGWLARVKRTGRLASTQCGLTVPRQNGKNAVLEIVELFKMVCQGRRVLHTAHEVKTARKAFLRLASFFENERQWPELAALVAEVRRTNGQEAIVLTNGGSCEFIARSKGSGRGFTVDDLVCDESQELSDDALAALLPTISAAPSGDPQTIFTGTPPSPSMNGEVFTRTRESALGGKNRRACWDEWSFLAGVDLDDLQEWANANPGLGIRLLPETIEDERSAMDDETFARERGGMWDSAESRAVIDGEIWARQGDQLSLAVSEKSLAVDVSPDQSTASVGLGGRRGDGSWHVELVEHRAGVSWLVPFVTSLLERNRDVRCVVVDAVGVAASLQAEFASEGVTLTVTGAADMGSACASLLRGVYDGSVRHTAQPQLASALKVAQKRNIAGGEGLWGWSRATSASDITPVVAVTLALWGAQAPKSKVKKPRRSATGKTMFFGGM